MKTLRQRVEDPSLTPMERLELLMEILRSPEGCNWDRQQTHESLLPYLIEETYEVVETIESGRLDDLREELGDLLTQVVFHAQLANESGRFRLNDAITSVVDKLIQRHPHVFEERKDLDPKQVRDQWERRKTETGEKSSVLGGLPRSMPALSMAFRMGEKAGGVGFDWQNARQVMDKIEEELTELKTEIAQSPTDKSRQTEELGDLLFAVASLSRKLAIDPEFALRKALEKFRSRFNRLEETVTYQGKQLGKLTLEELETIWQQLKKDSV